MFILRNCGVIIGNYKPNINTTVTKDANFSSKHALYRVNVILVMFHSEGFMRLCCGLDLNDIRIKEKNKLGRTFQLDLVSNYKLC